MIIISSPRHPQAQWIPLSLSLNKNIIFLQTLSCYTYENICSWFSYLCQFADFSRTISSHFLEFSSFWWNYIRKRSKNVNEMFSPNWLDELLTLCHIFSDICRLFRILNTTDPTVLKIKIKYSFQKPQNFLQELGKKLYEYLNPEGEGVSDSLFY